MAIVYCVLILAGAYFFLILAPACVMCRVVFSRKKPRSSLEMELKKSGLRDYPDLMRENFRFFTEQRPQRVTVRSPDGTELVGDCYRAGGVRLAVCLHGYRSTPLSCFASLGRFLMEQGWDVLLVHQRAHGESGGNHSTLGMLEQEDVLAWSRWACENSEAVILAGVSMGCVAVSYASDRLTDPKLRAMILDCGFTSPYDQIVTDSQKWHVPIRPLMPVITAYAKIRLGIDIRIPVWESLEHAKLPAFFIHGGQDEAVPLSAAKSNYAHCASPKELLVVENAHHAVAFLAGGEKAKAALHGFLMRHDNAKPNQIILEDGEKK